MKMLSAHPCAQRHPHQHQHQQHHHQQHQSQHQQQLQEQYKVEPYANDPYRQHGHVAVDPPVLKDTMFSGGSNYVPVPSVADQPADVYHRPITTTAASMATAHYPIVGVGSVGNVYTSCVDELYDYNKDLISGGGPPDLSHQYYDHGICWYYNVYRGFFFHAHPPKSDFQISKCYFVSFLQLNLIKNK